MYSRVAYNHYFLMGREYEVNTTLTGVIVMISCCGVCGVLVQLKSSSKVLYLQQVTVSWHAPYSAPVRDYDYRARQPVRISQQTPTNQTERLNNSSVVSTSTENVPTQLIISPVFPGRSPDRQCLLGALLPRAWHPARWPGM